MTGRPNADVTNCDREPIHVPGSVQPHGSLFALDPRTLVIEQISSNVPERVGHLAGALLGKSITSVLQPPTAERLQRRVLEGVSSSARHLGIDSFGRGTPFELVMHQHDGVLILEAEPALTDDLPRARSEVLRESLDRAERAPGLAVLSRQLTDDVRTLSGYDRVLLYRFAPDGHGEVVAESIDTLLLLQPLLGLRFPAGDIPAQARAAMTLCRSRTIVEVRATASKLIPLNNPRTHRPLDLTHSSLRSSSPIHLEYLGHMGVTASFTISLVVDDTLWGMIACHHHSGARRLSYDARLACEHLTRALSLHIGRHLAREAEHIWEEGRLARDAFAEALPDDVQLSPSAVLLGSAPILVPTVRATGFAVVTRDDVFRSGNTPGVDDLRALTTWLAGRGTVDVWATDSLLESGFPEAERLASVMSGLVALPLTQHGAEWVLWLRGEDAQTVTWAGRPEPMHPLAPRKSFAASVQSVHFRSTAWMAAELQNARRLRVTLAELVYRHSARVGDLNAQLRRVNSELDAFAYVASHDLKAPVRSIRGFAQWVVEDAGDVLNDAVISHLEQIVDLTGRMDQLIESLLRYARWGRQEAKLESVSLETLIAGVVRALSPEIERADANVEVHGALPTIRGDVAMLGEVFTNVMSNALKFTTRARPQVKVSLRAADPGSVRIAVKDDGIGIAADRLGDVFKIFRRLHPMDGYRGGAGVGLSIAQKLVHRHRGSIDVESTIGVGSTFVVTLPLG